MENFDVEATANHTENIIQQQLEEFRITTNNKVANIEEELEKIGKQSMQTAGELISLAAQIKHSLLKDFIKQNPKKYKISLEKNLYDTDINLSLEYIKRGEIYQNIITSIGSIDANKAFLVEELRYEQKRHIVHICCYPLDKNGRVFHQYYFLDLETNSWETMKSPVVKLQEELKLLEAIGFSFNKKTKKRIENFSWVKNAPVKSCQVISREIYTYENFA